MIKAGSNDLDVNRIIRAIVKVHADGFTRENSFDVQVGVDSILIVDENPILGLSYPSTRFVYESWEYQSPLFISHS